MDTVHFAWVTLEFDRFCIDGVYDTCIFPVKNITEILLLREMQTGGVELFGWNKIQSLRVSFGKTKRDIEEGYVRLGEIGKDLNHTAPSVPIYLTDLAQFLAKISSFTWKKAS